MELSVGIIITASIITIFNIYFLCVTKKVNRSLKKNIDELIEKIGELDVEFQTLFSSDGSLMGGTETPSKELNFAKAIKDLEDGTTSGIQSVNLSPSDIPEEYYNRRQLEPTGIGLNPKVEPAISSTFIDRNGDLVTDKFIPTPLSPMQGEPKKDKANKKLERRLKGKYKNKVPLITIIHAFMKMNKKEWVTSSDISRYLIEKGLTKKSNAQNFVNTELRRLEGMGLVVRGKVKQGRTVLWKFHKDGKLKGQEFLNDRKKETA